MLYHNTSDVIKLHGEHMRPILTLTAFLFSTTLATAGELKVMASIKPIHSLVAQVMEGVGEPGLIVEGTGSPHTYSLKPAKAAELQKAQVVFWVGHELEAFLEKPIESLGAQAKTVSLMDAEGIRTLPPREAAAFGDHDHGGSDEHAHDEHGADAHIWLDPENAQAMLKTIAQTLADADPANAGAYGSNAVRASKQIDTLSGELAATVAPARNDGFIVFHDAYQYFEKRFGLEASGAISINPENPPGAKAIAEIRARISGGKIKCVFSEPQFDSKLINLVLEGSAAKSAVLDPLGAELEPGPELYGKLLKSLAQNLAGCLAG
jgi:zinc transport system substrate-binding protein